MTVKTAETLEERAARVAVEAAEVRTEMTHRAQAEAARLTEHQAAVDAELIQSYDRKALEAEVDKARAALDKAIANDPLTKALAGYYVAAERRRAAFDLFVGAKGRQGHDTSGAVYPQMAEVDVVLLMVRAAQQAGSDARVAAETAFHDRYANPDHQEQP